MSVTLLEKTNVPLLNGSSTLLTPVTPPATPPDNGLTPLPQGNGTTLTWVGGQSDNDPTVAGNWNPNVAPAMAANQTLVMTKGTMEINGGNLQANQLNVETSGTDTATIKLKDHGTLDLNVPDTKSAHANVDLSGGGQAVMNVFTGPTGDSDVNVTIDAASMLNLQANMTFGKLSVHGGSVAFEGESHLNGTSVLLDTKLSGFGDIDLATGNSHPGRMELVSDNVPVGVNVNVLDNNGVGGSNGLILDKGSTTPGGNISLADGFVKLRLEGITSFTQQNGEFDLYSNGTKVDALNVSAATGSNPLQVGSNANGVYIYNCSPNTMPLGAGNGLGGGGGSGGGMMNALVAGAGDTISALPMHS